MTDDTREALLADLTEAQRAAVVHVDGPLLVLAGPGSGKTTVVTRRIAHLLEQGIPPWQILALTFTNKAAGEMRERIERGRHGGASADRGLTVTTFHSFCARVLRRWADATGISARFSIYDASDQRDAIRQAIKAAELSEQNFTPAAVAGAIGHAKNRLQDAAAYAVEAGDFYARAMARAYTAYERILRSNDALDFDDLLLVTARLLRQNDDVRRALQERYQYLLVDEYQDTNHAQFVIAGALAAEHRNICVVGDPDQSIYGWRGADIRNILEFEQQYPEATVLALGQNFRSTGHILAVADHLIRNNARRKHKPLFSELGDGERPTIVVCRDEHHEADLIADEFRRRHEEASIPWKGMAVLYRVNALSRVLEEAFRNEQIPYVIARGTAFYARQEIKDALAYLRLIVNPSDEIALRRVVNTPARGIGRTTLDRIELFAMRHETRFFEALGRAGEVEGLTARSAAAVGRFVTLVESWRDAAAVGGLHVPEEEALADLVERVVRESGLEALYRRSRSEEDHQRLENLEELISAAAQFVPVVEERDRTGETNAPRTLTDRLAAFLESVALVSDADAIDPANGAVTLMTLHAAKGLEFDVVAVAGLEHGLLPHMRATERDEELEEERRLCFVGITRARRHLLLTRAAWRTHRGLRERTIESQFIGELPAPDVVVSNQADDDVEPVPFDADEPFGERAARRGGSLLASFPRGALVRHPTFGVGRVESVTPRPGGSSARVAFRGAGTKTLILEYAKLERLT